MYTSTSLESAFNGLQIQFSVADNTGLFFIPLAVIASETREMSRNFNRIQREFDLGSRTSKVIDLGVNGKPLCDLILVTSFSRICYRFRDIHG